MDVITKLPINMGKGNTLAVGTVKPKEFFGKSADYLLERGALAIAPAKPEEAPKPESAPAKPEEGKRRSGL